jgi:hypothetical protein
MRHLSRQAPVNLTQRFEKSSNECMAAAAAVGNCEAIRFFAGKGFVLAESHLTFASTIQAAASTGKTEAITLLLGIADRELATTAHVVSIRSEGFRKLDDSLTIAINLRRVTLRSLGN